MLTPTFKLSQDDEFVYLDIDAPYARVSDSELDFCGTDLTFFAHPYYLRLNLPGTVVENGKEQASWDVDKQAFAIRLPKQNVGEQFGGLDMLTKLLTVPKRQQTSERQQGTPGIEVISELPGNEGGDEPEDDDFDWHLEQQLRTESDDKALLGERYGFANRYAGVFNRLQDETSLLIDLAEPDSKPSTRRQLEREQSEKADFVDEHYLSDLYDQVEEIEALVVAPVKRPTVPYDFSSEERFQLKNLPRRAYLLEKHEKRQLLLGMIDILFAYAYDLRTTDGEHSVESAWTITKLSSTLCWLDSFENMKQVLTASVRRSLCYPLYRNWKLSQQILSDVLDIVSSGPVRVVKCFLDIHRLFNEGGESRYVLNDLFITDYCVWLQRLKHETLEQLGSAMKAIEISKADVGLDLELLEQAACLALEETDISQGIGNLAVA